MSDPNRVPRAHRSKLRQAAVKAGYRSGFEWLVARSLEDRELSFEYEPKDSVMAYEVHEKKKYLPDFRLPNGIIVECKGRLTARDRKKLLLVKEQNPDVEIRLLFQYNNKLAPRSNTRYGDWATKHGFTWALESIPREWYASTDRRKRAKERPRRNRGD